jgi:hypothetical protein
MQRPTHIIGGVEVLVDEQDCMIITKEEYEQLQHSARKLTALENAGVDNWEWYGDAMEALEED